jgi:hypothetical protein
VNALNTTHPPVASATSGGRKGSAEAGGTIERLRNRFQRDKAGVKKSPAANSVVEPTPTEQTSHRELSPTKTRHYSSTPDLHKCAGLNRMPAIFPAPDKAPRRNINLTVANNSTSRLTIAVNRSDGESCEESNTSVADDWTPVAGRLFLVLIIVVAHTIFLLLNLPFYQPAIFFSPI